MNVAEMMMMFLFVLTLMVMRNERASPCGAGGYPEEKPPDLDAENGRDYATAYYWDMYGAMLATYNAKLSGTR